jgi:hypothetical protein
MRDRMECEKLSCVRAYVFSLRVPGCTVASRAPVDGLAFDRVIQVSLYAIAKQHAARAAISITGTPADLNDT